MSKIDFNSNDRPTLGVELELALVDTKTMALTSKIAPLLARVPEKFTDQIKPELMQCYLEINTKVCENVKEAEEDLTEKIVCVEKIADEIDCQLYWTATHPFSSWTDQQVSPNERYEMLLDMLAEMARQLVTFGLHVHVGVDSGDKAVMICDRILRHLPTLLALSANSPWWENRITGLKSHRSKIMEALPTAGLPTLMRNWSEYVWLVNHLIDTGFINTIREIWWDVRPHHNFGTVEVRVCDMPGNLHDAMGLVALIQCLVQQLSTSIDEGTYQHDCHPMMARQNKWRAARYGMDAELVDEVSHEVSPVRNVARRLVELLSPAAEQLDCLPYLQRINTMTEQPGWADQQLHLLEQTSSKANAVRALCKQSRLS